MGIRRTYRCTPRSRASRGRWLVRQSCSRLQSPLGAAPAGVLARSADSRPRVWRATHPRRQRRRSMACTSSPSTLEASYEALVDSSGIFVGSFPTSPMGRVTLRVFSDSASPRYHTSVITLGAGCAERTRARRARPDAMANSRRGRSTDATLRSTQCGQRRRGSAKAPATGA